MRVQWIMTAAALIAGPLAAQQVENAPARRRVEAGMPRVTVVDSGFQVLMDRRPRLGLTLSLQLAPTDSIGALVLGVTPGGPAAKAGIRSRDIIVKVDGRTLVSRGDSPDAQQSLPGMRLIELSARLQPNDTIPVELRRGSERKTLTLVTGDDADGANAPMLTLRNYQYSTRGDSTMTFFRSPSMELPPRGMSTTAPGRLMQSYAPELNRVQVIWGSPLADLELAPLNDDLGGYFGTTEGVLVISVPKTSKLEVRGGDVILSIDGRKPTSPSHLMRILQSYENGESFRMDVMRNHHRETVTGRLAR